MIYVRHEQKTDTQGSQGERETSLEAFISRPDGLEPELTAFAITKLIKDTKISLSKLMTEAINFISHFQ